MPANLRRPQLPPFARRFVAALGGGLGRFPGWARPLALAGIGAAGAGAVGLIALWLVYTTLARGYDLEHLGHMPERSVVLDVNGNEMGRLHGQNRIVVPLAAVSPHFVGALLAREDNRFYRHRGVDFVGAFRALFRNLKDGDFTQGASTLTMQLARSSYQLTGKSIHRKLLEIAIARRIEASLDKDRILELYLNRIFFGTGIYGVERAAQVYFGKPAGDLTLDEAAMLAAIIRGPNRFSPFRQYEVALSGRNMVLDRMVLKERIDATAAAEAKKIQTKVQPPPDSQAQENYALDAVRRDLDRVLDAEDEEDGGLRIFTTIDLRLQEAAQAALESRLTAVENSRGYRHGTRARYRELAAQGNAPATPDYLQGAIVVFDNDTGATAAVVGGRDFRESSFNRALLAKRQVGSTFKPFVYTAAFQNGLFPTTLVDDGPVDIGGWAPRNSDGSHRGWQPADYGLYKSRNTMTVRVGQMAGFERVAELADRAGFGAVQPQSPQLYIGNIGATLSAVTSAYTAFPNGGIRCRPFVIDRIENRVGDVIFRSDVQTYRVLTPGASWCVARALEKVLSPSGTAAYARTLGFKAPAAGKTGTTDDFKDAWFVGFNGTLTCGVWVGMDQPEPIAMQGYGSRLALPVWVDVMTTAAKLGYEGGNPVPDVPVTEVTVCAASGQLATEACRAARTAAATQLPIDLLDRFATTACATHGGGPFTWRTGHRSARPRSSRSLWDRIRSIFR